MLTTARILRFSLRMRGYEAPAPGAPLDMRLYHIGEASFRFERVGADGPTSWVARELGCEANADSPLQAWRRVRHTQRILNRR